MEVSERFKRHPAPHCATSPPPKRQPNSEVNGRPPTGVADFPARDVHSSSPSGFLIPKISYPWPYQLILPEKEGKARHHNV